MGSARRALAAGLWLAAAGAGLRAIDLDVTPQDIERALAIARSTEAERQRFHSPYIKALNLPFIETAEIVSEFRRVVLIAEERGRKGDRLFGYSVSQAQQAIGPWVRRVGLKARLRFHPQNTYVDVPAITITLVGNARAQIGVVKEPILSLPSGQPGDRVPILGALVEGVFDAAAVGDGEHEFVVRIDDREVGRVRFDLSSVQ